MTQSIAVLLVISSFILPYGTIDRWNSVDYPSGDTVEVENQFFNDAAYLRENAGLFSITSNAIVLTVTLGPISELTFIGPKFNAVLAGEVNYTDVAENVVPAEADFPQNLYSWFEYDGYLESERFVNGLFFIGVEYVYASYETRSYLHDYLMAHSHIIVVIDNNWPEHRVTQYGASSSIFPIELRLSESLSHTATDDYLPFESYCTYVSSRISQYMVSLPTPKYSQMGF